jgi:Putative amidase domain
MLHLPHPRVALLALFVVPLAAAPPLAGARSAPLAPAPHGSSVATTRIVAGGPAAAAAAYLQARAGSVLGHAQAARLAARCPSGSALVRREALLAAGSRRLAAALGHTATSVACRVRIGAVRVSPATGVATVTAHAVSLDTWTDNAGRSNTEGEGLDHVLTLVHRQGRWLVVADAYSSDLTPRLLEAAGAPAGVVAAAARRLERVRDLSVAVAPGLANTPLLTGPNERSRATTPAATAPVAGSAEPAYVAQLSFDRAAAKTYADHYALSYNPTYASFSSDCADFGSQVMYAGGYPQFGSTYASGWWYDKNGTSAPNNDTYSHAWIAVANQQGAWNVRYTDFVSSISDVTTGDFIYYDWTGDGTWDHVAELVGTNSAGQKVVDAHTTDHYHTYWKMGSSSCRYRFARTRATVVI